MTFNVDVYLDDIWVKTYYAVEADDEASAQEQVLENLALDFSVDAND